ncbi:MAG: kelch repeat-containing protein, partial [Planctomycetota bacterium]
MVYKKQSFKTLIVQAVCVLSMVTLHAPAQAQTWTAASSMNFARQSHQAILLADGRVLVTGGYSPISGHPTDNKTAEIYDPSTDTWSLTGFMNHGRVDHTMTLLADGRVLVAGGVNANICANDITSELYDPSTGTWTFTGNLPLARTGHTATLLSNGKVLLAGGGNRCGGIFSQASLYDPTTNAWTVTGSMAKWRQFFCAVRLSDGRVLVAGGIGYGFLAQNSAEIYDPDTGIWSTTGSMTIERSLAGNGGTPMSYLIGLPDGRVLAASGWAGYGGSPVVTDPLAEVYDPSTGTWTPAGSMSVRRGSIVLAGLNDGRVMAAGGWDGIQVLSSVELWDPNTEIWSSTASLIAPRFSYSVTNLPNGSLLVAGGWDGIPIATTEIYNADNTPIGGNVTVQPVDAITGMTPVILTFAQVTQAGTTSLTTSSSGPPPPFGFKLGNPATYYDITTTAVFSGPIEVCIDYSGISFGKESKLKLFHRENNNWVELSISSLDPQNDIICASVSSLSLFAIFEQENRPPIVAADNLTNTVDEGQTADNSGTISDPDGDIVALSANIGTIVNNGDGTWSWSFTTSDGPGESQTVIITADDGSGGTAETSFALTVNNVAPALGTIIIKIDGTPHPAPIITTGTTINASTNFDDPGTVDTHTATWDWGDGTTAGTVTETNGSGTVDDSHTYNNTGVY